MCIEKDSYNCKISIFETSCANLINRSCYLHNVLRYHEQDKLKKLENFFDAKVVLVELKACDPDNTISLLEMFEVWSEENHIQCNRINISKTGHTLLFVSNEPIYTKLLSMFGAVGGWWIDIIPMLETITHSKEFYRYFIQLPIFQKRVQSLTRLSDILAKKNHRRYFYASDIYCEC